MWFYIVVLLLLLIAGVIWALVPTIWIFVRFIIVLGFGCSCFYNKGDDLLRKELLPRIAIAIIGAGALWFSYTALPNMQSYFWFLFVFLILHCILANFTKLKIYYVLMPLLLMWLIGCDISHSVKAVDTNIVYVEYQKRQESENGLIPSDHLPTGFSFVFDDIYDDVISVPKEHVLHHCSRGEIFYVIDNVGYEQTDWLHVRTEDGIEGYIHSDGLKKYYGRTSENIVERRNEYISGKWYYRFVPRSVLMVCEFIYEHSGFLSQIHFAD